MVLAFARVSCLLHLAEKPDATEAWLLLGGKKKKPEPWFFVWSLLFTTLDSIKYKCCVVQSREASTYMAVNIINFARCLEEPEVSCKR